MAHQFVGDPDAGFYKGIEINTDIDEEQAAALIMTARAHWFEEEQQA